MRPALVPLIAVATACGGGTSPPAEPPPETPAEAAPAAPAPAASAPVTGEAPEAPDGAQADPSIAPAVETRVPPVPAEVLPYELGVSDVEPAPGQTVRLTFWRPGPDGCYRQSPVRTTVEDHHLVHAYTTSREGDVCTEALVPGGFITEITPNQLGHWKGDILVDGENIVTYELDVKSDPAGR